MITMNPELLDKLRYPVGKYNPPAVIDGGVIEAWKKEIAEFPAKLAVAVHGLNREQLDWVYRPEGWSIQQLVHHCADSHMNALVRFKLCLTEDLPTIKPYAEERWALLSDTLDLDISHSIKIVEGLHARMVKLIEDATADDLKREFIHPEHGRQISFAKSIGTYAWHSRHHLAHIMLALESEGKYNEG